MKYSVIGSLLTSALMSACSPSGPMKVTVENPDPSAPRQNEIIEVRLSEVVNRLGEGPYRVTVDGMEIPSQVTSDSLLIFQADVDAGQKRTYVVALADSAAAYPAVACGRLYPERADDLAWENDLVGFRAYGPATQAKGERAYGYDIFFKHPSPEPMLEKLYGPETSAETWATVDSLRKADPERVEEFINSISYHIDHGLGMDCYAVGPTLGDGVAALVVNDSIRFPWCYASAEVLDNGPLRFAAELTFEPVGLDSATTVTEHRIIRLDAGQHLNECVVWFDGLDSTRTIAAGFPRRDIGPSLADTANWILAYSDPTQGPDNGRALLGLIIPEGQMESLESEGHIQLRTSLTPADSLRYYWGFAWDRADIPTFDEWTEYLAAARSRLSSPLKVSY